MVLSLVLKQVVNNLMFFGCSIVSFNFKILFFNCIFYNSFSCLPSTAPRFMNIYMQILFCLMMYSLNARIICTMKL